MRVNTVTKGSFRRRDRISLKGVTGYGTAKTR
jgi:hypothetical protein